MKHLLPVELNMSTGNSHCGSTVAKSKRINRDFLSRFMNITMNEVVFIDQRGKYHAFDNFMIPARNIKFVHIPEKVRFSYFMAGD